MNLREKIVANKQKYNLTQMHEQLAQSSLDSSLLRRIFYPESSNILEAAFRHMNAGFCEKSFYNWPSPDCEKFLATHLAHLRSREKTAFCLFPTYSPRPNGVISDLPVLEVSADTIDEWYEFAKNQELHFFLCSSTDLRKGLALDVYEADPGVHAMAGAVCDFYFWSI